MRSGQMPLYKQLSIAHQPSKVHEYTHGSMIALGDEDPCSENRWGCCIYTNVREWSDRGCCKGNLSVRVEWVGTILMHEKVHTSPT